MMSDLNDPRVLFAAERTLLAWNRTSISLMAFGFFIERFGLYLQLLGQEEIKVFQRHISFFVGESFVLLALFWRSLRSCNTSGSCGSCGPCARWRFHRVTVCVPV